MASRLTFHRTLRVFAAALALLASPTFAEGADAGDVGCPTATANLAEICIDCFYPMEIAGVPTGPELGLPDDRWRGTCVCPGRFGYPTPGLPSGMWIPKYVVETTRLNGCSPVAGGTNLLGTTNAIKRSGGYQQDRTSSYSTNVWSYPLASIAEQIPQAVCSGGGGGSEVFSLEYMSALDPTADNEELAMMITPDALLYTTPIADAACMADAVASTTYKPILALYYCAGSWGRLFPLTNLGGGFGADADEYSLVGAKTLAKLHRWGNLWQTYGYAICMDLPAPIMSKHQYKFQQMFPIPELVLARWMGANSTVHLLEPKTLPVVGEDYVQLIWSYDQCCSNF